MAEISQSRERDGGRAEGCSGRSESEVKFGLEDVNAKHTPGECFGTKLGSNHLPIRQ